VLNLELYIYTLHSASQYNFIYRYLQVGFIQFIVQSIQLPFTSIHYKTYHVFLKLDRKLIVFYPPHSINYPP